MKMKNLSAQQFIELLHEKRGDLSQEFYTVMQDVSLNLTDVAFHDVLLGNSALFHGNFSCDKVNLLGNFSCGGAIFQGNFSCRGGIFGNFSCGGAVFHGNFSCGEGEFLGDFSCGEATFKGLFYAKNHPKIAEKILYFKQGIII